MTDVHTPRSPRTVLVTGGTRGIGRAIAAAFRADGADVTVTGRDPAARDEVVSALGVRALAIDVDHPEQIESLREEFPDGLDVVVNNAGGFTGSAPADAPLTEIAAAWRRDLDRNLVGAVLTVAAVMPRFRPGGSIISIGSIGAEYAANAYSTAKAALAAWNAGLSAEVGPRGLTANVVAPGFIDGTDLFGGKMSDSRRADLIARTHDGRAGTPQDVADVVRFLAGPAARHITGQTIHLNGGAHTTR
jgi:3-oxoacyl-[acyl-carrier protein] reductase